METITSVAQTREGAACSLRTSREGQVETEPVVVLSVPDSIEVVPDSRNKVRTDCRDFGGIISGPRSLQ